MKLLIKFLAVYTCIWHYISESHLILSINSLPLDRFDKRCIRGKTLEWQLRNCPESKQKPTVI